ncbi:hypothetical protein Godav_010030, partial [Gossypium davidsonii]|nr:hypothetical protein [Gossypium davidsonii]
ETSIKKYESEFEEGEGEGVLDPQQIEEDLFNHIAVSFRASGSFMMKRMSFKRMIRRSCRVEPYSTRYEIDLPKIKAFFE